jgi:hypothetical protein
MSNEGEGKKGEVLGPWGMFFKRIRELYAEHLAAERRAQEEECEVGMMSRTIAGVVFVPSCYCDRVPEVTEVKAPVRPGVEQTVGAVIRCPQCGKLWTREEKRDEREASERRGVGDGGDAGGEVSLPGSE